MTKITRVLRGSPNGKRSLTLLILMASLVSGCSVFYTPGMSELEMLCKKDGGTTIYKAVKVKGYLDGRTQDCYGCWNKVILHGYDYIEFKNKKPRPYRYFDGVIGYHRIFKAAKNDYRCNTAIWRWNLSKKVGSKDYDKFFENYCIASEPIDRPAAQYGYFEKSEEWRVNDWYGSTIGRFYEEIRDLSSGEIIGEETAYVLNPWPKSALSYGVVYDCQDIGEYHSPSGYSRDLRSAVLDPD